MRCGGKEAQIPNAASTGTDHGRSQFEWLQQRRGVARRLAAPPGATKRIKRWLEDVRCLRPAWKSRSRVLLPGGGCRGPCGRPRARAARHAGSDSGDGNRPVGRGPLLSGPWARPGNVARCNPANNSSCKYRRSARYPGARYFGGGAEILRTVRISCFANRSDDAHDYCWRGGKGAVGWKVKGSGVAA